IRPYLSTAPFTRTSTSPRFVTSVLKPRALPPLAVISVTRASIRSFRLAPSATFAPFAARRRAELLPTPLLAPVITTTLSAIFGIPTLSFSLLRIRRQSFKTRNNRIPAARTQDHPALKRGGSWRSIQDE